MRQLSRLETSKGSLKDNKSVRYRGKKNDDNVIKEIEYTRYHAEEQRNNVRWACNLSWDKIILKQNLIF